VKESIVVLSRVFLSGLAVSALASAPLAQQAQEPPPPAPTQALRMTDPQDVEAQLKPSVRSFEQVVANAVIEGGKRVKLQAEQYYPDLQLELASDPLVSGVFVPNVGLHFDVQCPDILGTSLAMIALYRNQGLVRSMAGTVPNPPPANYSAQRAYGEFVRDTLKDAMVDFSGPLALDDGEWLVVVARVPQVVGANRSLEDNRQLVLQVLGKDLLDYRAGTISRDEAKARIKETRF
jgi:hypothetical protein